MDMAIAKRNEEDLLQRENQNSELCTRRSNWTVPGEVLHISSNCRTRIFILIAEEHQKKLGTKYIIKFYRIYLIC